VANPKIIITGDSTGAVAAVKRLSSELSGLQSISARALSFGGVLSVAAVVAGLVSITKAAIDQGDAFNKMSQKTGIAVEDLGKLQYAADLSGVSAEALQKGLTALAVGMVDAASGAGPMAEEYKKLGINLRNTDGTMKSSLDVLGELADRFQQMPDGVEKTNLAVDIFGKKLGAEMIPLLNSGAAGLKAMGDEAQSLGLVMSGELAKKSEEFNDNLSRLSKLSSAAGIEIANALIPSLNALITEYLDARKAGLSFMDSLLGIGLSNPLKTAKEQIADLGNEIKRLKEINATVDPFVGEGVSEKKIADLEKLKKYYELQQERETGDGIQSAEQLAAKRVVIEAQMQSKLAELAKLRGIAEGKVSADILQTDDKRIAAQIANAQKLRDALSAAWKQSITDAEAAGKAAEAAFEKAADIRTAAEDKARAKERSIAPGDNNSPFRSASGDSASRSNTIEQDFRNAANAADENATLAKFAAQNGRAENAARLAKQAAKDAERAVALADQISDPQASANAIREAAQLSAGLQEAQAQAEQKKQKDLEERAKQQNELVAGLDQQITDLQTKAASIQVSADISAAQGALATLQAQLAALQDKTVTVTVVTKNEGGATGDFSSGAEGSFARGGYTGHGGKWQPAGIVHAGEFVHRQEVVRQPGALAFLERFNREGMAVLRRNGFADGGLVSNLAMLSLSRSASQPSGHSSNATFKFPGFGSFDAYLAPDPMRELKEAFSREALKKGGRR
jgi:hypothetical protein